MSQKKQGFVHGALILMLSNIIVKVVGALFKIPLSNVIGDTAMGYFNSAYSIYSMCFLISTAGLPVAISRLIAAAQARKNTKEADLIYRISLLIFVLIGLFGTSLLFFGSDLIASIPGEPELGICIKAISPIMFFICLVSCIRGYFQGSQNMIPTAVSQVLETLGNLCLGLTAGIFASKNGYAAPAVAAFALGGVTFGVIISAVYMAFAKWMASRDREKETEIQEVPRKREIASKLIAIAIPITISSSVLSLTSVIDSMLAVKRLNEACVGVTYFAINEAAPVAMTVYGAYMAKAITFFNLPPTIIYPFAISIIPAISGAEETRDRAALKKTMDFTFRIVSVIALPCAFGLGVLAKPIINLLFSTNDPIFMTKSGEVLLSNNAIAPMLSILAPAIVFSGLISVSGAMLQASGHERKSILSTCCGVGAKALAVWILIGIPSIGHYGIPLSTLLCYLVMFCFNMFFLSHFLDYRISFRHIMLKPLFAALSCGITAGAGYFLLAKVISPSLATIASILMAALIYVIVLFKSGGFGKEDVLMLPKGETLLRILSKLRLLNA